MCFSFFYQHRGIFLLSRLHNSFVRYEIIAWKREFWPENDLRDTFLLFVFTTLMEASMRPLHSTWKDHKILGIHLYASSHEIQRIVCHVTTPVRHVIISINPIYVTWPHVYACLHILIERVMQFSWSIRTWCSNLTDLVYINSYQVQPSVYNAKCGYVYGHDQQNVSDFWHSWGQEGVCAPVSK